MASSSGMMAGSMAVSGMSSAASAYSQSQAMRTQGEYQKQQADTNARLAEMQGKDAIERGKADELTHRKRVRGMVGSQRANMAAQGIELDDGSALEIQQDTAEIGEADALTIRNNAWREAWGYKVQASNSRFGGEFAKIASKNQARNTLITGGMNALSSFGQAGYYYKKG